MQPPWPFNLLATSTWINKKPYKYNHQSKKKSLIISYATSIPIQPPWHLFKPPWCLFKPPWGTKNTKQLSITITSEYYLLKPNAISISHFTSLEHGHVFMNSPIPLSTPSPTTQGRQRDISFSSRLKGKHAMALIAGTPSCRIHVTHTTHFLNQE